MELDYTGAKTLEEKRAIHKTFWDNIHKERAEGKRREITREEFDRQVAQIREINRKNSEQQNMQSGNSPDNTP